ncbi:SMI1/KNR4 family protein [Nocardia nova]|uniref:SMI1/KNR4 family protein n=1 Tax=Nocardia nova TaxID=37330 RepID=UPI003404905C
MSGPVEELARFLLDRFGADVPVTWSFQTNRDYMKLQDWPRTGEYDDSTMMDLMDALDEALRAPDDDRPLIGDLTLNTDPPHLRHTFELASRSPCSVLLDPEFRYPNDRHTRPVPESAAVSDEPTDPEVLRRIEVLVTQWAIHHREIHGAAPEFGEPYTEEQLSAIEQRLGVRLPEDLRALYRLIGDDDYRELGLLGGYSLQEPAAPDDPNRGFGTAPTSDAFTPLSPVVFDASPVGAVRRVSSSDGWIPIGTDYGCNAIAVDLDPGPDGRYGQILEFGRDFERIGVLAESVTALLSGIVATLLREDIDEDDWPPRVSRPDPQWQANVDASGEPVTTFTGVSDVEQLQHLRLTQPGLSAHRLPNGELMIHRYGDDADPGRLDLSVLSATSHLRQVEITWDGEIRLWLPHTVESLELNAPRADLSDLAGHPALWNLTLGPMPVRARDLAALPELIRLDASAADIDDVVALADLDVRILLLRADQWQRLRRADRLPKRLAGAQWIGDPLPIPEAADFSAWLRTKN